MNLNELKKKAAWAALDYIYPGTVIGVGTGSTVFYFIQALSTVKHLISGAVSSSNSSTVLLKKNGIRVLDLNTFDFLEIYVDSADEINNDMQMIKGGGAALTKEKIIAAMSKKFVCIIDESKKVNILGTFPLPIEIIPIAFSYISKEILKIGGQPKLRENIITDNGNVIIDVYNLFINDPISVEKKINSLPGVVSVGLFASRVADVVLIGTQKGVEIIKN
ncbi:ribose-5-phosphate isomerase RpiA [Buchnera aphidicola]|jgi:ribose 5-phosphate isomerase A|uniref:Ribose-5-phosphate isomerase A n=1 Tax=Buchnera aphidicola subsp. Schizaphis graminum (strain Sg) TaxID=198804 RepID=RPIA_BUCAP|nr:ribose-5-phosphate isomerase RpiA [Buchnera aphidicola]Q8K9E2.1 RecName: Full=Ribose-5-phosphate isomerase A; AltName: Full=Phosphoriboisomerase A; Short=PRI [Buchnera aphidicola str. Sg (Schizaphis graminum)]AAM67948.1 ribose 5-phosphate isomerase a [Buchnera aphidicola str. Sg (Schizaphis graminum)]AWI49560.1 ribose-5-phosphate isomerase RpiA [Buchnera aphidicola (Schizaphis graminum)]